MQIGVALAEGTAICLTKIYKIISKPSTPKNSDPCGPFFVMFNFLDAKCERRGLDHPEYVTCYWRYWGAEERAAPGRYVAANRRRAKDSKRSRDKRKPARQKQDTSTSPRRQRCEASNEGPSRNTAQTMSPFAFNYCKKTTPFPNCNIWKCS